MITTNKTSCLCSRFFEKR